MGGSSPPPPPSSFSLGRFISRMQRPHHRKTMGAALAEGADSLAAAVLPLASIIFALSFTALLALAAQQAHIGGLPTLSLIRHSSTADSTGRNSHKETVLADGQGDGREGMGQAGASEGGKEGAGSSGENSAKGAASYSAPFLSDLLPDSGKGQAAKVVLSAEEEELLKAEAVYKHSMIRRSELAQGWRPEPPFHRWKAGRLREVFLTPTYPCPHQEKMGSKDFGKWICNKHKLSGKTVVVYTFGAFDDLSFESALHRSLGKQTEIHTFNPGLSARSEQRLLSPQSEARTFIASFLPMGTGSSQYVEAEQKHAPLGKQYLTLPQIMEKMGKSRIDILKIDCDGCERGLFQELSSQFRREKPPFDQLILQIHDARRPTETLPLIFALEDMGFRLFHSEPHQRSPHKYDLSFVHELYLYPGDSIPSSSNTGST